MVLVLLDNISDSRFAGSVLIYHQLVVNTAKFL